VCCSAAAAALEKFVTTTTFEQTLPRRMAQPTFNPGPIVVALMVMVAAALYLATAVTWRQSALFLVGAAAGVVLYHAAFGFTSAWRVMIAEGRGDGLRAQMLMLAVTCLAFFPVLANGELFGRVVRGSISPVGWSVVAGAFIFGVGMQLGGGCASGTLYTAGGGSVRMLVTLAAFIAGSVLGVLQQPMWERLPRLAPISLVNEFGVVSALAISLSIFGGIALASLIIERRRTRTSNAERSTPDEAHRTANDERRTTNDERRAQAVWLRGPWPLVAGALGLAAVNIATLALAGRPWGVTSAFALWGSKMVAATGVDVASWSYWQTRSAELQGSVLNDVTSVMNFGIVLGALTAAGLAGRFAPTWRVPARSLAAAVIGGLMLGYGARIAYGCNIGAYFSGISSASVHGWVWFAAAFAGNAAGTRLRPFFGLRV
jgi:uncharacterized membrane protein YedE/YeeE